MKIPKIGLVMKSLEADFFIAMQKGAEEFANNHRDEWVLRCFGTHSQTEVDKQIAMIDRLIEEQVDGIVVVPIDSKRTVDPIARALSAGIKVVNIDIELDKSLMEKAGIVVSFAGPDNEAAAFAVGEELSKKLNPGDPTLIIEGLCGAENAAQRKKGFMRSIEKNGLHLLASKPADWETDKAQTLYRQLYKQYPECKGIYCSNDAMALGVIRELQQIQPEHFPYIIGFDNDASIQPHLQSRELLATVDIFSSQMAVEGIRIVLNMIDGNFKGGDVITPYQLIK